MSKSINYRTEGMDILLNEDCILARYHPLIPLKELRTQIAVARVFTEFRA